MLSLKSDTDRSFVDRFEADTPLMVLDHAHCESKAASTALGLIFRYPEHADMVAAMTDIVEEEMQHFRMVLALMARRGWSYAKLTPSSYAARLQTLARKPEPDAFVDRMIMCALIEARSCERFKLLSLHLQDRELAEFYGGLFESEARHYATYLKLALQHAPEADVRARLEVWAAHEAEVCRTAVPEPRLHA
jgi:tRNA-(ms[2]io[6]A)-hydroxylase